MVKRTRKFGGETFSFHSKHEFCGDARELVKKLRKRKLKARIVKIAEKVEDFEYKKPYEKKWNRCAIYVRK